MKWIITTLTLILVLQSCDIFESSPTPSITIFNDRIVEEQTGRYHWVVTNEIPPDAVKSVFENGVWRCLVPEYAFIFKAGYENVGDDAAERVKTVVKIYKNRRFVESYEIFVASLVYPGSIINISELLPIQDYDDYRVEVYYSDADLFHNDEGCDCEYH